MTLSTQATGDVPMCAVCGGYLYGGQHYCLGARQTGGFAAHTDDLVRAALVRIAADHEVTAGGHRKKLSRSEMLLIAREACLAMGWEWSKAR